VRHAFFGLALQDCLNSRGEEKKKKKRKRGEKKPFQ